MAEAVFRKLADDRGLGDRFNVSSSGVSSEESGNDIYPPAKRTLSRHGISFSSHRAHRITDAEFASADFVIALDSSNLSALVRRFGHDYRIMMLLSEDVDDPWYTGDFEKAYQDIYKGCLALISELRGDENLFNT